MLYGPKDIEIDAFARTREFKAKRDTFRQTVGRATKDIDTGVALYVITNTKSQTISNHWPLITRTFKSNRWIVNGEDAKRLKRWCDSVARNREELAVLLFTPHGDLSRWRRESPIQAQNKITRLLERLNRIEMSFLSMQV